MLTIIALLIWSCCAHLIEMPLSQTVASRVLFEGRYLQESEEGAYLGSSNNHQYLASIYVGTKHQKLDLVIDTGTSQVWFAGTDCPTHQCTGERFVNKQSQSFTNTYRKTDLTYDERYAEGFVSTDQICLVENPKIKDVATDVAFVLAYLSQNMQDLPGDGMLGLAPNPPGEYPYKTFVQELYDQRVLDQNVFSLFLANEWSQSKIWFGGFSHAQIRESLAIKTPQNLTEALNMTDSQVAEQIKWADLGSYYFWSTKLKGVTIGNFSVSLSVYAAVYSTAYDEIYVPSYEYETVMNEITRGRACSQVDNKYTICECSSVEDSSFPSIEFDINQHVLSLQPEWYLQYRSDYNGLQGCVVKIQQLEEVQQNYWLLGTTFLRSHMTIYDRSKNRIGFIQNQFVPEPIEDQLNTLLIVAAVLIVAFACLITVVVIVIIVLKYKQKKQIKSSELGETKEVAFTEAVQAVELNVGASNVESVKVEIQDVESLPEDSTPKRFGASFSRKSEVTNYDYSVVQNEQSPVRQAKRVVVSPNFI